MKNILNELVQIEKKQALEIISCIAKAKIPIQLKIINENQLYNVTLEKKLLKNRFYLSNASDLLKNKSEVTLKMTFQNKLYFLKTNILNFEEKYYFDSYENLFELIRRKSSRFQVPKHWRQSAYIQAVGTNTLRSISRVLDISKTGMKLKVGPQLPRYEVNQIVNLKFKLYRRGEIVLNAKIIHLKKSLSGGPVIGLQFIADSSLLRTKIQNIYEDLAFFYINQPYL